VTELKSVTNVKTMMKKNLLAKLADAIYIQRLFLNQSTAQSESGDNNTLSYIKSKY
jgi:hypothetical protein